jgi:hypothetical protein
LQLQRLAYEEIRVSTWSDFTKTALVTKSNELLGCLHIKDLIHPLLRHLEEIDVTHKAETTHEAPNTIDAAHTVSTPLDTPSSNIAVPSETSESAAKSLANNYDPPPQALGVTRDTGRAH